MWIFHGKITREKSTCGANHLLAFPPPKAQKSRRCLPRKWSFAATLKLICNSAAERTKESQVFAPQVEFCRDVVPAKLHKKYRLMLSTQAPANLVAQLH